MKNFIAIGSLLVLLTIAGHLSGQSILFQAYNMTSQSDDGISWNAPYFKWEYLFFPDDEDAGDLNDGRYITLKNGTIEAYGFYQTNETSLILQDYNTKEGKIFVIRKQTEDSLTLYNYDLKKSKEQIYNLESAEFDQQAGQQLYVDVLFDLNEDDLQYNYKQGLENFGVGIFYAPGEYHRLIKFYSGSNGRRRAGLSPEEQDSLRTSEISKRSFSYGLILTTKISKSMLFESGIVINRRGFQTRRVNTSDAASQQLDYSFNYVDVPLILRVYPIKRTIRWYLKIGLIPQFYRGNEVRRSLFDSSGLLIAEEIDEFSDGQFVNLDMAATVGTGLEYVIGNSGVIFIQPSFQSMLKAFASQRFVKRYLNQKSIAIGVKLSF